MSVRLMSRVWDAKLQPSDKLILLCLADFADDDGKNCFPSINRVARKVGMSARTVKRHLAAFRESDWLRVLEQGGGRSNPTRYQILYADLPINSDRLTPFENRKGDNGGKERVTTVTIKGDTTMSPDPSVPTINPPHEQTSIEMPTQNGSGEKPQTIIIDGVLAHLNDVRTELGLGSLNGGLPPHREKVRARLKHWTPDQLKQAIDAAALNPWVLEKPALRMHTSHVFRNDTNVERYLQEETVEVLYQ